MILYNITSLLTASLFLIQLSAADTLVLKNGKEIEGKIIRETADDVLIEILVTKTIKDEMTVPKSEIKLIRKESQDSLAFIKLEELIPTPDLLTAEQYKERIEEVQKFIGEYPESKKVGGAKKIQSVLEGELEMIQEGGFKFRGKIVDKNLYEANAYEYDVAIAEKELEEVASKGDFLVALRLFDKYEDRFSKPESYPKMRELMLNVLSVYGASIDQNMKALDTRLMTQKEGLEQMSSTDSALSMKAIEDRGEFVEARLMLETKNGEAWITPDSLNEKSLSMSSSQVVKAVDRLKSSDALELPEKSLAEVYRFTWGQLASATSDEDKKIIIEDLEKSGLPEYYLKKLEQQAGM